MLILPDSGRSNLGVAGNFTRLLKASTAEYVMFANPDDVWYADKIQRTLRKLQELENNSLPGLPCVVHTNMKVVDSELKLIANSMWAFQGIVPRRSTTFASTCIENTMNACTIMMNRTLVNLVDSIPDASHNEDWWVCMVAKAFGQVAWLDEPTMFWRRHGSNDSQASSLRNAIQLFAVSPANGRARIHHIIQANMPRVQAFLERYGPCLSERHRSVCEAFLDLLQMGPVSRRFAILKYRFFFGSIARTLGVLLLI